MRVGQAERLKRGQPAIAIVTAIAVSISSEMTVSVSPLKRILNLSCHPTGRADGGRLLHRAVRRRDVDTPQIGLIVIIRDRGGYEQELVGSINVVVVTAVENRFARDRLGGGFSNRNADTCVPCSHRVYVSPVSGLTAFFVIYVCEAM